MKSQHQRLGTLAANASFGCKGFFRSCWPSSAQSSFTQHRLESIPFLRWRRSPVRCRNNDKASSSSMSLYLLPHVGTRLLHVLRLIRLAGTFFLQQASGCWPRRAAPHCTPSPRPSWCGSRRRSRAACSPLRPLLITCFHPNVRTTIQVNIHLDFLAHLHIFALHVFDKERFHANSFESSTVDRSFASHFFLPKAVLVDHPQSAHGPNHIEPKSNWARPRFSYAFARSLDGKSKTQP